MSKIQKEIAKANNIFFGGEAWLGLE